MKQVSIFFYGCAILALVSVAPDISEARPTAYSISPSELIPITITLKKKGIQESFDYFCDGPQVGIFHDDITQPSFEPLSRSHFKLTGKSEALKIRSAKKARRLCKKYDRKGTGQNLGSMVELATTSISSLSAITAFVATPLRGESKAQNSSFRMTDDMNGGGSCLLITSSTNELVLSFENCFFGPSYINGVVVLKQSSLLPLTFEANFQNVTINNALFDGTASLGIPGPNALTLNTDLLVETAQSPVQTHATRLNLDLVLQGMPNGTLLTGGGVLETPSLTAYASTSGLLFNSICPEEGQLFMALNTIDLPIVASFTSSTPTTGEVELQIGSSTQTQIIPFCSELP